MKKITLLATVAFLALQLQAQEIIKGKITYEQVVKLEIKLEGEMAAQLAGMIPSERKSEKILWFNPGATLYENSSASKNEDIAMQHGGANVMFRMAEPENKVYRDLAAGSVTEQRDFMTRMFLIEDSPATSWKITGNQKIILDYPCMEATSGEGDKKVTAWFTPVIPVSGGPGNHGGLPGMILALEANEGKQLTTAVKIESDLPEADLIVKPEKGRKVTREEFDKIVEEKMKEMGAQPGAGGQHMMIRIQR
jgi:GLPGLI family protein